MTARYQVGGTATCTHASALPASAAARAWLAGVQSVAAQQDFFVTPYADVDVAALSHRGLNSELADAFADGRDEAKAILHGQVQRPPVAPAAKAGGRGRDRLDRVAPQRDRGLRGGGEPGRQPQPDRDRDPGRAR